MAKASGFAARQPPVFETADEGDAIGSNGLLAFVAFSAD